ncbi:MAG TPA: ABC transporter ATP-binding protein [Candidatus Binataceae bacterium]|nr:ABC transporter ATP-binding protein [Candidatus Binataceae bacterium]
MNDRHAPLLSESVASLWRLLRRFGIYIRRQRSLIALSMLALVAEAGLRLIEPWPLKLIFDRIIAGRHHHSGWHIDIFDRLSGDTLLLAAVIAMVAFTALRALFEYLNSIGFATAGNRVLSAARYDLYRHLQCLSLAFHGEARGGDLTLRVMSDLGVLTDATTSAGVPLFRGLLIMCATLAFMLWMNLELGLIALIAAPLFWAASALRARRIVETLRHQRQRDGAMAATAAETISAIKLVQAFALGDSFAASFAADNDHSLAEGIKASRLAGSLGRSLDVLTALVMAAVLWFGAHIVKRGEMSVGDLVIFLSYLRNAFRPLKDFAKQATRLARAVVAGERALAVFDQTPSVCERPGAADAAGARGEVAFVNVSFGYAPGRPALTDITFKVRAGQRVALIGPSGSGKSTLLGLLPRLYDVGSGAILLDGRDLRDYTLASLRAQISIVPQDSVLFAGSVRDNIAYGAPAASPAAIEAAARLANAHQFIEALPLGYDTPVGERGVTLSGGQRQRIAIARAAIRRAPLLILDEPTNGLDRENSEAVIAALKRLPHGQTTFIATHDLELAADADLILYFEHARIVEHGTHAELLQHGRHYREMLGRNVKAA